MTRWEILARLVGRRDGRVVIIFSHTVSNLSERPQRLQSLNPSGSGPHPQPRPIPATKRLSYGPGSDVYKHSEAGRGPRPLL